MLAGEVINLRFFGGTCRLDLQRQGLLTAAVRVTTQKSRTLSSLLGNVETATSLKWGVLPGKTPLGLL